jgi:formylglycine-generating enzyme required for sulfatase activity
MGSDKSIDRDAFDSELPQHIMYLPTYYIGRAPVTVQEWRNFVQESGHTPEDGDSLKGKEDTPVVYVTWNKALKFAHWYGMSLPSEAEWEKAARGTDGRIYPWGNEWKEERANTVGSKIGKPTPVGDFSPQGDSPYGCVDMIGNIWEWTRSLERPYPYQPEDGREDIEAKDYRVLRGGAFDDNRGGNRCAARLRSFPPGWGLNFGFRVVLSPFFLNSEL